MPETVLYISYNGIKEPLVKSQVLNYLEGLQSEGYRFLLLTFERNRLRPDEQSSLRQQLNAKGIEWSCLSYHNNPKLLGTVFDVWAGTRAALKLVKKHDVRLLHARSFVPALIARKVKQQTGLPFINDIRGFWVDEKAYKGSLNQGSTLYKWAKRLEKSCYLESDAIVSLSEAGLEEIRSWGEWAGRKPPSMVMIPTCVDLNAYQPKQRLDAKTPVFGYVGSLGRGYLGLELFRFFKRATKVFPGSRLLVVSRTDRQLLQQWLMDADLDGDQVDMVSVEPGEVPGQVASMDVGLSFIEPHYSKKASCPTKLGEYLAAGIPVIANPGIGDTDAILNRENTGIMIEDFNDQDIDRSLKQLGELLADGMLSERCRQIAEQVFSLKKGIAAYANLYRVILA